VTVYLDADTVVGINRDVGGPGALAVNRGGIEAAVARPRASAYGKDAFPDIWSKAAALLNGLSSTQYFTDGNKRTAWLATDLFLQANGHQLRRIEDVAAEVFVLGVSTNLLDLNTTAEWLRVHCAPTRVYERWDPRVEYAYLAADVDLQPGSATVSVLDAQLSGLLAPTIPTATYLYVVARLHWTDADAGRAHSLSVRVDEADGIVVPAAPRDAWPLLIQPPARGQHPYQPGGWMPSLVAVELTPYFERAGVYRVILELDGTEVADLPLSLHVI
jgi:prophage maintenance system killer protein